MKFESPANFLTSLAVDGLSGDEPTTFEEAVQLMIKAALVDQKGVMEPETQEVLAEPKNWEPAPAPE